MRRHAVKNKPRGTRTKLQKPVLRAEFIEDVRVKCDVYIVEMTVAHKIRTADELLFRRRTEKFERAGNLLRLHRGHDGQRRRRRHGAVDVMTFTMAGSASNDLRALGAAGAMLLATGASAQPEAGGLKLALGYDGKLLYIKVLNVELREDIEAAAHSSSAQITSSGILAAFKKFDIEATESGPIARGDPQPGRRPRAPHKRQQGFQCRPLLFASKREAQWRQ